MECGEIRNLLHLRLAVAGLLLALTYLPPARGVDDGMHLVNMKNKRCLTVVSGTDELVTRVCDNIDVHQKWQWIWSMYLRNIGAGKCIEHFINLPHFRIRTCINNADQMFMCSFNILKLGPNFIGAEDDGTVYRYGNHRIANARWETGDGEVGSICNVTNSGDWPKWWRFSGEMKTISSGLNRWTALTNESFNIFLIDQEGKSQLIVGHLVLLSIAPNALWGITSVDLWCTTTTFQKGRSIVTWEQIEGRYLLLDFRMPDKGFVVTSSQPREFCARLGITDENPKGSAWQCEQQAVDFDPKSLSCGTTGCYIVQDTSVRYRVGITDANPVGTGWVNFEVVPHMPFYDIAAGPNYELWGIIKLSYYVYRRIGITNENPIGLAWERVPNIAFNKISIGLSGPVGIRETTSEVLKLNGSPTPQRQHEMDKLCESLVPCAAPGAGSCVTSGDQCHARYDYGTTPTKMQWRCYQQEALGRNGQVSNMKTTCYYTRHAPLNELALKRPVLGSMEKQMWLDQFCNMRKNNPNLDSTKGCSYYAIGTQKGLVCRVAVPSAVCPTITGREKRMLFVTKSPCGISFGRPEGFLSDGAFSATSELDGRMAHHARLEYADSAWCAQSNNFAEEFLEMDFRFLHKICRVGTQSFLDKFVQKYKLQYSSDYVSWNYSSVFGSAKEFQGSISTVSLKHYLPTIVEARFLRIRPSAGSSTLCLKMDFYGSSKETEAYSCEYYRTHLFASQDGLYNIYSNETGAKRHAYCTGLSKNMPAKTFVLDANDLKLHWPLNATEGEDTLLTVHGRTGVNIFQNKTSKILGDFSSSCISDPNLCVKGLTLELWLWFTCPASRVKTIVIQSGFEDSRGFTLYMEHQHVCFEVRGETSVWKTCQDTQCSSYPWLHVIVTWTHSAGLTLIVDDLEIHASANVSHWPTGHVLGDIDTLLRLGSPSANPVHQQCSFAVNSLSIWMKRLANDERDALLRDGFQDFMMGNKGESCSVACARNGLKCYPVMGSDITAVLKELGVDCSSVTAYGGPNQPLLMIDRTCHGFFGLPYEICCDCTRADVWRFCRCKKPTNGSFTDWGAWSFCTRSCGSGRRIRSRTCTNPPPLLGGAECEGPSTMMEECHQRSCDDSSGVLREIWFGSATDFQDLSSLEKHPIFPSYPSYTETLESLESPSIFRNHYGQRLKTYFRPPSSGYYTFTLNCTHSCVLFSRNDTAKPREIIRVSSPMEYAEKHHKFQSKSSVPRQLSRWKTYELEARHVNYLGQDHLAVGLWLDSGGELVRISNEYFTWKRDPLGVSRELWTSTYIKFIDTRSLTSHITASSIPTHQDVLGEFTTAQNFGDNYGQRLRAYFLAPSSGSYTFQMYCDDRCELWFGRGVSNKNKILDVVRSVDWSNRWTLAQSQPNDLEGGEFYFLEVLHVETTGQDFLGVGITLPDGTALHPINKTYLWRDKPGNLALQKPAHQSSIYGEWFATNAVDGDLSKCSHTNAPNDIDPWLFLDMTYSVTVRSVVVTNRDILGDRLDDFEVRVGNSLPGHGTMNQKCTGPNSIPSAETMAFPCFRELTGRYVSVHIYGINRMLTICELVVYGLIEEDGSLGQGLSDGRIEDNAFAASSQMPSYSPQYVRLFHPCKSWCAREQLPISFKISIKEKIDMTAVATQGDRLQEKWVTKFALTGRLNSGDSFDITDLAGNKEFHGNIDGDSVVVNRVKKARIVMLEFLPLQWYGSPCARLEIYGKDVENDYSWFLGNIRNSSVAAFPGTATLVEQPLKSVLLDTSSQIKLFGFDKPCLINPKSCLRSIWMLAKLSLVDPAQDGFIFTTTNYNTSVVGISLLVENQEIVAIVRTETRFWRAAGPAQNVVGNMRDVKISWSYDSYLQLVIGSGSFRGKLGFTERVTAFEEHASTVLKVGGRLDFSINSVRVILYEMAEARKIKTFFSVDGVYSSWTSWGYCSKSCGNNGYEARFRHCNNPVPQFDGRGCETPSKETRPCLSRPSCEDNRGVLREVWLNRRPSHFSLKNVTEGYSSHLEVVSNFSLINDSHSNFGQRLRAFLFAKRTGSFIFQLSCSFQCDLWISPNDEAKKKAMLLSIDEKENSYQAGVVRNVTTQYLFRQGQHFYVEVRSFEIKDGEKVPLLTIVPRDSLGEEDGFKLVRHKPDCFHGLGMESGAIHDGQILTQWYSLQSRRSYFGRLNGHNPFCVRGGGHDRNVKVDLIELHWIIGVVIQGYNKQDFITKMKFYNRLSIHDFPSLKGVENALEFNGNKDAESTKIVIFDKPLKTRYAVFRVMKYQGLGCLRMEVIGCHAGNLAMAKHTELSSTLEPLYSFKANDGIFARSATAGMCAHSLKTENPFWSIDLENSYYISEILILQRQDCCQNRLHNFDVRIGNANVSSGVLNPRCGGLYSMVDVTAMVIRCIPYNYGRYLTISIPGTAKTLTLCEVAIFQIENDTVMSNWSECSVTCGEGVQYLQPLCIKPYYCKTTRKTRPCVAAQQCEISMQNCRQLQLQGHRASRPYLVRPDPELENKTWIYCDQESEHGGWLVIQRRHDGSVDFDQSWESYRNGFGNISTEFWIGNEILHQMTRNMAHQLLVLFKRADGTTRKTGCDFFNVSSEMDNYRLVIRQCHGPDVEKLSSSNFTEFSTRDSDHGSSALNCDKMLAGGWWYGSCNPLNINGKFPPCSSIGACDEIKMMIRPEKVDGGWSHWTSWATCDKPCGGGNSTRLRYCTEPPPGHGGLFCEGISNKTRGCNPHRCRVVELNITLKFTEEMWDDELEDLSSVTRENLMKKITKNIKRLYNNDPTVNVSVRSFRQGSVFADIGIYFSAVDEQQLVALQEDLDQDGLLNQDMPVVYDYNDFTISEVPFARPEVEELVNRSSTSIYIKWRPPNVTSVQASLLGYRIYYKKQEDTSLLMLTASVSANVEETEIDDLEVYTKYTVRICAFSSNGNGLPSFAYYVRTDEDVPSEAPVISFTKNTSSTSLYLEWNVFHVALFHGRPLGFTVHYRRKNTTVFLNQSIDGYLNTNTSISGLMKYTKYQLFMTARTKKGDGVEGELMNLTTDEDVPSQPPSNISLQNRTSSSLQLSWFPIPHEWIHGILRGYRVMYWPLDDFNEIRNATAQPNVTEIKLEGLRKFTNYSVRVAGMTSKGVSNWSKIVAATDEDVPIRGPSNLIGISISPNAINVSWSSIPKEFAQGVIRGYRIYYDDKLRSSGNMTASASQTQLLLSGFMSYTLYNITVAGFTKFGEGPRTSALVRTDEGAPSRTPWDLTCPSASSYTISIQWYPFTPDLTGSQFSGYAISYEMAVLPGPKINFTVPPYLKTYTLAGLKGFAQYSIAMYVYSDLGRSNTSTVLCNTEEGKPLASPANVKATSNVGADKIFVEWDHVPPLLVRGIRRGYTILYQKVSDVGVSVVEKEHTFDVFDPDQREAFLVGLDHYSGYAIKVRVFNSKLRGDTSESVYAETCHCVSDFYLNWCNYIPYVNTSDAGIFPPLVKNMIAGVCGNCSGREATAHFDRDFRGYGAEKSSMVEVKLSISEETQVNFPVSGRRDGISSKSSSFLSVIHSPGSVFVTTKPNIGMAVSYGFFETIANTLPLLAFATITASLAGILMWCLETKSNQGHFPRRFTRGASEGFWWSFISMTTVGYGDRAPVTIRGRLFAMVWTLYGLVITSLVIGNLTSALTASVVITFSEVDLYQSKIATLENSSEYKLGMSKGAHVNTARNYSSILSVLHAVKVGAVDGALLDMYVVASWPEFQRKNSPLIVKAIIPNPSVYGLTLSGHAKKLRRPFAQYLNNNAALVVKILEENIRPVKEEEEEEDENLEESDESSADINVLSPDSPVIHKPLLFSSIALAAALVIGLFLHFTLFKSRRKADKSNAVSPDSDVAEQRIATKTCVKEFCESTQRKVKDLKQKHREQLRKMMSLHSRMLSL